MSNLAYHYTEQHVAELRRQYERDATMTRLTRDLRHRRRRR
jgi:hypothetical protein